MNMYYNTKKNLCNYPVNSIQAWFSFISGSFSCSEKSFSGYFGFPSPQKPTPNSKFKFDLDSTRAHLNEFLRTLMCSVVKQITKLQHSLFERQTPDAHFTWSPSFHQCSVLRVFEATSKLHGKATHYYRLCRFLLLLQSVGYKLVQRLCAIRAFLRYK